MADEIQNPDKLENFVIKDSPLESVKYHTHNGIDSPPIDTTANNIPSFPISIANGGTGKITAPLAINALLPSQTGKAGKGLSTDGSTAGWGLEGYFDAGNSGSSKTLDWTNADSQLLTMTAACTLTLSNPVAGRLYRLKILQDSTGGWGITWPASVKWPSGTAPSIGSEVTSSFDVYAHGEKNSGGTNPLTFNHTPGTGSNQVIIITISSYGTVSNVTYGGVAATLIRNDNNNSVNTYLYYLVNPPAGTNTVSVSSTDAVMAGCASFNQVASTVIDTSNGQANFNTVSNTATLTPNKNNEIVVGITGSLNWGGGINAGNGQTVLGSVSATNSAAGTSRGSHHYKIITPAASYTSTYTGNGGTSDTNSQTLVALRAALSGIVDMVYLFSDGTNYYGYSYINLV
jgi:hypothetical protein